MVCTLSGLSLDSLEINDIRSQGSPENLYTKSGQNKQRVTLNGDAWQIITSMGGGPRAQMDQSSLLWCPERNHTEAGLRLQHFLVRSPTPLSSGIFLCSLQRNGYFIYQMHDYFANTCVLGSLEVSMEKLRCQRIPCVPKSQTFWILGRFQDSSACLM